MKLRVLLVVMCAALLVVPAAFAEMSASMSLSADIETNTTFSATNVEVKGGDDLTANAWDNDGRTKVHFEGKLEGDTGWFAAGKGQAVLSMAGTAGVDDSWVEIGTESLSVKVGRYEYIGAYGKGQDTYIAEAPAQPDRYEGKFWRGRPSGDINNIGVYFGGLELGFVLGGASDDSPIIITETDPDSGQTVTRVVTLDFSVNAYAFRPAYEFSGETFTVKISGEYGIYVPQDNKISTDDYTGDNNFQSTRAGAAANVESTFGASTVGLSGAYGMITGKTIDDSDSNDNTQMSVFGYWKMGVGEANTLGLGAGYSMVDVENVAKDNKIEAYVSFTQQLPVEGLKIKYAASYAGATLDPDEGDSFSNSGFGGRVRLNYDF